MLNALTEDLTYNSGIHHMAPKTVADWQPQRANTYYRTEELLLMFRRKCYNKRSLIILPPTNTQTNVCAYMVKETILCHSPTRTPLVQSTELQSSQMCAKNTNSRVLYQESRVFRIELARLYSYFHYELV